MGLVEDFLSYPFLQNALLAGVLVALLCGVLGVFLVLRGLSLLGDGLAHLSFGGIAIGLVAGVFPLATALAVAVLGAVLVHELRERSIVKGDAAVGILFTAGLAVGILLVSWSSRLATVQSYLFGSIITVTRGDLWVVAGVGAVLLALLAAFYREFVYMTFSEEAARVSGLPVRFLNLLFVSLTATVIVVASRITGVLLVSALLVVPASTAIQFGRGFAATLALSVGFGLLSVLAGLAVSVQFGTAPGATMACVAVLAFALAASLRRLLRPRRIT